MSQPLTVFNASAGSGKTFTLAVEYIKLLIKNPLSYKEILAVTFTNKATEEMKMRILSQLYGIWKQLPDSESYMNEVTGGLGVTRDYASSQAGIALHQLIHDYSYFRVQTIDTFFQSVLRNLARELDLTANLRVGLNDLQVEDQAVDLLIESLTNTDIMLHWIMSYISANISDDKGWNVIKSIKSFGGKIFHDDYKTESKALNEAMEEKDFFKKYVASLEGLAKNAQQIMTGYADEFFQTLDRNGLSVDDLSKKSIGIASYFNKLKSGELSDEKCLNKTLLNHLDDAETWVTKSNKRRNIILPIVEEQLLPLLEKTEKKRATMWKLFFSVDVTKQFLYQLRLLGSIDAKVRELNRDANRFLLSDTQHLLKTMINDSDSPFIFERIGAQLKHIMIDEFQDTSTIQWNNFKVLLKDAMSHADNQEDGTIGNLIVGDVKQSIYRWRSGDWRLLNDIDSQFSHPQEMIHHVTLDTNYRSARNIVDFNNAFFKHAIEAELKNEREVNPECAQMLAHAYQDVKQLPKNQTYEGLVSITLLPNNADFEETMLKQLVKTVRELLEKDVSANEIAILVRNKINIPDIADFFMRQLPEVRVVSDEAFRLDASSAVNILIEALRLMIHPDDELIKASLAKAWQEQIRGNSFSIMSKQVQTFLPPQFSESSTLKSLPLYELIEQLYSIFGLAALKDQSGYVCTFFDCVNDFVQEKGTDISAFLQEWDDNLYKKTIQSSEINGIRIITIHKSKGLEFDNVIIPYCNWQLENHRDSMLWCKPKEETFNKLPWVPVRNSSKLLQTIYADDYREEHLQNTVDNMNLLYVAFTRASKNLFVIGKLDADRTRSALIQKILPNVCEELKGSVLEEAPDEKLTFMYGNMAIRDKDKKQKTTENVFSHQFEPCTADVENFLSPLEFRQSNKSRDFIHDIDDDSPQDQQNLYIKIGNILHNLFSHIRTTDDIDGVLRQLEFEGILYDEQLSAERIRTMLQKRLSHPRVADWFSNRWQLFNECTILSIDKDSGQVLERRPDRVMTDGKQMIVVDFKFGKPREEYIHQVRQYMSLLSSMGYEHVEGYLWYVYSNQIVSVN